MRNKKFRLMYKGTPLGPTYDSAERALEALKRFVPALSKKKVVGR